MDLALQYISIDQKVRSNTIKHLKDFYSQPLSTQAKK